MMELLALAISMNALRSNIEIVFASRMLSSVSVNGLSEDSWIVTVLLAETSRVLKAISRSASNKLKETTMQMLTLRG